MTTVDESIQLIKYPRAFALIRDFGKRPRQIPPRPALRAPIHARYSWGSTFQRVIVQE